jgi:hypothetical protein
MSASESDVTARPLLFLREDERPRSLSTPTVARGTDDDERAPAPSLEIMPTFSSCEEAIVTAAQSEGLTSGFVGQLPHPFRSASDGGVASTTSTLLHT